MLPLGHFSWGGHNFSESADHIALSMEGPNSVPVLHADLRDSSGKLVDAKVNLSEHIGTRDATFLVDPECTMQRRAS